MLKMSKIRRVGLVGLMGIGVTACSEADKVNLPRSPELTEWHREERNVDRRPRIPEDKILDLATDQKGTSCFVHGEPLLLDLVPIEYGLFSMASEYMEVLQTEFPHSADVVLGGCIVGDHAHARVKYCPRCQAAKLRWLMDHPRFTRFGDRAE